MSVLKSSFFSVCFVLASYLAGAQIPFYEYRSLNFGLEVPKKINSTKSAVIITVPDEVVDGTRKIGEWKEIAEEAHAGFRIMGVDALFYLNEHDLLAANSSMAFYAKKFAERGVKNLIFIAKIDGVFHVVAVPFSGDALFIKNEAQAFRTVQPQLKGALLTLGREIKRSGMELGNFLIPETVAYLSSSAVLESRRSEQYPGQIRRNKIVIERFEKMPTPKGLGEKQTAMIEAYNQEAERKNTIIDTLLKDYPFEYKIIDRMSNADMLRNRYQFVLRSVKGPNEALREMLGFKVSDKNYYPSIIPIMPDDSENHFIDKDAIVYKYYLRNNISNVIYVGKWDSHEDWQTAFSNFLNNAIQTLNKQKR